MGTNNDTYAAIDLGSNSFHMIVARFDNQQLHIVDRIKDMVRLSAGMDKNKNLTPEAEQRALDCLAMFKQRIENLPMRNVRAVGTNTLRSARNAGHFIKKAEKTLGCTVEIISGIEEARLIYRGVAHSIGDNEKQRLVMDIGGGSTELIIGKGSQTLIMESLYMGCVSYTQRFFADGQIDSQSMRLAQIAARVELVPIMNLYRQMGWDIAIGTSGTIKAVLRVVSAEGWAGEGVSMQSLKNIVRHLEQVGHVDKIELKGLSEQRRAVFAGGVAVLYGLFQALDLKKIQVSDGALREGLLYDMYGSAHEDVRNQSVTNLAQRFQIDPQQAQRVLQTSLACLQQVAAAWKLDYDSDKHWLSWAAQLHELGLGVAHSHYHKHGAYIVENADLAGFSQQDKKVLALLVRLHRRKFATSGLKTLSKRRAERIQKLGIILRISVLLHRSRNQSALPDIKLQAGKSSLKLQFPTDWLNQHQLTSADLQQEIRHLQTAGIELAVE